MSASAADRPLRRDAVRNRARILEAAAELFAERGLTTSLNDIAHHSGLGVGTVYRHFPDRDQLIETLFEARVDEMVALAESALADPDPWHGFTTLLERSLERQAANRGLHELVISSANAMEHADRVRERILPIVTELLVAAQATGAVRADIDPSDLPIMQVMIGAVVDASRETAPELWRRYLGVLLRGIATNPESLPELTDHLHSPDEVHRVLISAPTRTRS